jgi:hypothetical protein
MFYFRRRLPAGISKFVSNQFICLSLRTHLPLDAVKRAARLLSVYEKKELDCNLTDLNDRLIFRRKPTVARISVEQVT